MERYVRVMTRMQVNVAVMDVAAAGLFHHTHSSGSVLAVPEGEIQGAARAGCRNVSFGCRPPGGRRPHGGQVEGRRFVYLFILASA